MALWLIYVGYMGLKVW